MSAGSRSAAGVLSQTLRRDASNAPKTLRQDVKEMVEKAGIGAKPAGAPAKTASKVAAFGVPGRRFTPRTVAEREKEILVLFESEVEMNAAVERGTAKAVSPDLTKRERALERAKRAAATSPYSVNDLLSFGLEQQQVRTLEQLLGQLFGTPIELATTRELRNAQGAANELITEMKAHWDKAIPTGRTRSDLLKSAFDELTGALKKDPQLNPSRFIREKLFDPWRQRFMKRLGADRGLVSKLRSATGVEILTDSATPRFSLQLKVGNKQVELGFDVDHAETRLSDAVRSAKRPDDLRSVIDSDGMQLLTPRENRLQIEALRKATREYFEDADEAAIDYFRRNGTNAVKLNREIDDMLNVLDRPGDYL